MKQILALIFSLFIIMGTGTASFAQKKGKEDEPNKESGNPKLEKKIWKKKAKTYAKSPLQLRDDLDNLNKQVKDLSAKNKELMDASQPATPRLIPSMPFSHLKSMKSQR